MKIIVACDKYKGSLSCFDVCNAISDGIRIVNDKIDILQFPMADGGDGFSDVMKHYMKTTTIKCKATDALGREKTGTYQWQSSSKTAIIDLATVSGITLLSKKELNPLITSTYGTGLLIKDAIKRGAKKIILGVGGSATNDAGTGILSALGFQFVDQQGNSLVPNGGNLLHIKNIHLPQDIPDIEWNIACDVNNPFYGKDGAAFVYAQQKGASPQMIKMLDDGLKNIAKLFLNKTSIDVSLTSGAGAAGGVAGGLMAMLNAKLLSGLGMVMSVSNIRNHASGASLIITGEGKIDSQSLQGKVVGGILAMANKFQIPCVALCGKLELTLDEMHKTGFTDAFEIAPERVNADESIKNAELYLKQSVTKLINSIKKRP